MFGKAAVSDQLRNSEVEISIGGIALNSSILEKVPPKKNMLSGVLRNLIAVQSAIV